jgi:cytidylate kinase
MLDRFVIALDGPSATGKGTCGRELARRLACLFVDTGAMYRTLTWHCLQRGLIRVAPQHGLNHEERDRVIAAVATWEPQLVVAGGDIRLTVGGHFPEKEIRGPEVSNTVAHVSPLVGVRVPLVRLQRRCLEFGSLVMDGRDIGTQVFPETPFKFFITASADVARQRRRAEGADDDTDRRNELDRKRQFAPMVPAADAIQMDNSHESPAVTVEFMLTEIARLRREHGL